MNTYKFSAMPSNAAVTSLVTVLVSAWFVLASGAILTDQHSEANLESARSLPVTYTELPDAGHMTIVVEARRSAASL
jgi:hypothetical protein